MPEVAGEQTNTNKSLCQGFNWWEWVRTWTLEALSMYTVYVRLFMIVYESELVLYILAALQHLSLDKRRGKVVLGRRCWWKEGTRDSQKETRAWKHHDSQIVFHRPSTRLINNHSDNKSLHPPLLSRLEGEIQQILPASPRDSYLTAVYSIYNKHKALYHACVSGRRLRGAERGRLRGNRWMWHCVLKRLFKSHKYTTAVTQAHAWHPPPQV